MGGIGDYLVGNIGGELQDLVSSPANDIHENRLERNILHLDAKFFYRRYEIVFIV